MTDRPILFSGPMVRAILDGRKSQTRRVIKPRRHASLFDGSWTDNYVLDPGNADWRQQEVKYAVGDRLWVREAWRCNGWATDVATIFYRASESDGYTAMCEQYPVADKTPMRITTSWRPGIHMPRWASRLTLIVTDVRVQRLQEVSVDDAHDEGTGYIDQYGIDHCAGGHPSYSISAFRDLWDGINAKRGYGWETNPWVVAISFRAIKQNIDQIGEDAA